MRTLELGDAASESVLQDVSRRLSRAKKVVFVTGAGVSCNAGIPDFRSEDGLYNMVKDRYPDAVVKGQDLFDKNLFRSTRSTQVFNTFMAGLRRATLDAHPTPTHHLIRYMRDRGRLQRCYTQNIDGLEKQAGLRIGFSGTGTPEVVQLHGDIHQLKCPACFHQTEWAPWHEANLVSGKAPECGHCRDLEVARELGGKRSRAVGYLRPNIVLYGEEHPYGELISTYACKDIKAHPDMLIIAGTSLKVAGLRKLVKDLAKAVHAQDGMVIFVNRTAVSSSQWDKAIDFHIQADTDNWVQDLRLRIPMFFKRQSKVHVDVSKRPPTNEKSGVPKKTKVANCEIKPEIEQDLLKCSPRSFSVFAVNPQPPSGLKKEEPDTQKSGFQEHLFNLAEKPLFVEL